jgi:nucleotide-binding universal stress UspA family protein
MSDWPNRKIVVAVDGSDTARSALRFALGLGQALACRVTAIAVVLTRLPGYRAGYFSFVDRHALEELRQYARSVLDEAQQIAQAGGNASFEAVTLEGEQEVFEQLADHLAQSDDIAFAVVGSYGHGLRDRHILGSTTQRLILEIARRDLKTPVLVVP